MRKRIADWLEKISAAYMVGAFLSDKGTFSLVFISLACLVISIYLTRGGKK